MCIDERENQWRAYPVLYIVNDIRGCDLRTYEVGAGRVSFYRHGEDMQRVIDEFITWGENEHCIPVICAYNLMFDLQPLMYELNARWDMVASAQSSTSAYTVDIVVGWRCKNYGFGTPFILKCADLRRWAKRADCPRPWAIGTIRRSERPKRR